MSDTETPPQTPRPPDIGRQTLTPLGYGITIAVPILIAIIGITYLHFHYDDEDLVKGTRVPVLTSDVRLGDQGDAATAEISGELTLSNGCIRLVGADGAEITPVFPADWEATVDNNVLKIYNENRRVVARGAQQVTTAGAFVDVGEYVGRPCAPASGEVAVVMSELTTSNGD